MSETTGREQGAQPEGVRRRFQRSPGDVPSNTLNAVPEYGKGRKVGTHSRHDDGDQHLGPRHGATMSADAVQPNKTSGFVDWMFRDRGTGKLVIAQIPNTPIIVWLVATGLSIITTGTPRTILAGVATVALVFWAGDELLRGVNPFRRLLGAAVLAGELYSLIRSH